MRLASYALAALSAIACVAVACSTEDDASPREPATCTFPDGTIRREGTFACPGDEQAFPCRVCTCDEGGIIGSSSYATDCPGDRPWQPPPDASGDGDANADADAD